MTEAPLFIKTRKNLVRPHRSIHRVFLQQQLEGKRLKRDALAHKMFTHGLDPVQSQGMQHGTRALHDAQDGDGEHEPHEEGDDDHDDAGGALHAKRTAQGHVPEHDGELLVRERQGPEAEVRSGVGDTVEAEFDGVDGLVDLDFGKSVERSWSA